MTDAPCPRAKSNAAIAAEPNWKPALVVLVARFVLSYESVVPQKQAGGSEKLPPRVLAVVQDFSWNLDPGPDVYGLESVIDWTKGKGRLLMGWSTP
jgi:hypothetical protein